MIVLNYSFTKILYIDLPQLTLWSSLSELFVVLHPGLQSSFCLYFFTLLFHSHQEAF